MITAKEEKELKKRLIEEYGEGKVIFGKHPRLGFLAFRLPTEEEYLDFVGSIGAPMESSGIAREQLCVSMVVYPAEPEFKLKLRRSLRALPNLASSICSEIEAASGGDYSPLVLSKEEKAALDNEWEFGWGGLVPEGHAPIILASDDTSGILVRAASDARQNGDADNGRKIRQAILALARKPEQETVEALLFNRPALLMPLWYHAQDVAGSGQIELGKC